MVVVRLSRGGSKKRPFFNIVVTDKRNRRDGRFIERLGFYSPQARPDLPDAIRLDAARLQHWQERGAQVSPTVARLVPRASAASNAAATAAPTPAVAEAQAAASLPAAAPLA